MGVQDSLDQVTVIWATLPAEIALRLVTVEARQASTQHKSVKALADAPTLLKQGTWKCSHRTGVPCR
eukprot:1143816-Pelagomonas_calceolata.AAC.1